MLVSSTHEHIEMNLHEVPIIEAPMINERDISPAQLVELLISYFTYYWGSLTVTPRGICHEEQRKSIPTIT